MRLAIVWRSRDIFSVVPRSVLTSGAAAARCRSAAAGSAGASGRRGACLRGLGRLLRGLGGGQYVLLADPSANAGPVERSRGRRRAPWRVCVPAVSRSWPRSRRRPVSGRQ